MTYSNSNLKPVTFKSKKYRDFIASHPCVISGKKANVHHEPLGLTQMGGKAPDSHCVPLSPELHTMGPEAVHRIGSKRFWELHNIDVKMLIIGYLTDFLSQENRGK
jgi:hypothetical protein